MKFFNRETKTPFDYRTLIKYLPEKYNLKVGIALGSGGARGLCHIGVIDILQSLGIRIDFISGASVGALIGAFLAAGKLEELKKFAAPLTRKESFKLADLMFPTSGLIEGKKIEGFLREHLGAIRIEDLKIRFACVATDFYTGREVILSSGDLVKAVRASISIPGVFKPVAMDGKLLVDGGVVNPVPVQVVRDLGAEFIIAVDICPEISKTPPASDPGETRPVMMNQKKEEPKFPNVFEVIMGSITIMESQVVGMRMKSERPDLIIRPQVIGLGTYDFHRYQEGVDCGTAAVQEAVPSLGRYFRLKNLLKGKQVR
jgi:NTE family protein